MLPVIGKDDFVDLDHRDFVFPGFWRRSVGIRHGSLKKAARRDDRITYSLEMSRQMRHPPWCIINGTNASTLYIAVIFSLTPQDMVLFSNLRLKNALPKMQQP